MIPDECEPLPPPDPRTFRDACACGHPRASHDCLNRYMTGRCIAADCECAGFRGRVYDDGY